jgi:hypothetical protein
MLPGLGRDWTEIIGALSVVYYSTASYAAEWEAVVARWAADDHTLLQPAQPCWLLPLLYVGNMLKQTVAKKELELCGAPLVSSAPRVVVQHGGLASARELTVTRRPRAGSASLVVQVPRRAPYTRAAPRNRPPRMSRRSSKSTPVASYQSTFRPPHDRRSQYIQALYNHQRAAQTQDFLQLVSSQLC